TVPVQAVQNGPEGKFLYVLEENGKVKPFPVDVRLVQEGFAVVEGKAVSPGMHVVAEGAQNLRPGSAVTEASSIKTGIGASG
ncbi:MAG TPA: efflux RND transporter periplasmic adaptor subunit, partial [Nitrosospira sp.]|nr:efflux RND transporter periplasmic adaptor subunit [Nitrosospira sp.]